MSTPDLEALAARVEAAQAADRELDAEIGAAIDFGLFPPPFTKSIDAALLLVPEGSHWGLGHDDTGPLAGWAWVRAKVSDGWQEFHSPPKMGFRHAGPFPATPALALCAAALRARSASS